MVKLTWPTFKNFAKYQEVAKSKPQKSAALLPNTLSISKSILSNALFQIRMIPQYR